MVANGARRQLRWLWRSVDDASDVVGQNIDCLVTGRFEPHAILGEFGFVVPPGDGIGVVNLAFQANESESVGSRGGMRKFEIGFAFD